MQSESVQVYRVGQYRASSLAMRSDSLAVEEPLEIRLCYTHAGKREQRSLSITMRTPGADFDLVRGFLFTEGILSERSDIQEMRQCGRPAPNRMLSNVVRVELAPNVVFDMERLERHFYTSSSCGVCGKSSLEALAVAGMTPLASSFSLSPELLCLLPNRLRAAQEVFEQTGGLHASALFSCAGELLALREDVGRHNALDKLIGSAWEAGELPLSKEILLLSGRVSFELMQKAIRAGISVVAAVGAPSSLAVDMAEQFGVLLVGFVREDRLNVYAGAERLSLPS